MALSKEHSMILQLLERPAFLVSDGCICHLNEAAKAMALSDGPLREEHFITGYPEYGIFRDGYLYLSMRFGGQKWNATVTKADPYDLFQLSSDEDDPALKALALSASNMRIPLADVMLAAEELKQQSQSNEAMAKMQHGLSKLFRIMGNMSDAQTYATRIPKKELQNLNSIFRETLEKAQTLLQENDVCFTWDIPKDTIYSSCNVQMLQRAAYNMISNAVKFAPRGSQITATLHRTGALAIFQVSGMSDRDLSGYSNAFQRYQRSAGLEDSRNGIGLGMQLIRSIALQHGGAVFLEKDSNGFVKVSMSMRIQRGEVPLNTRTLLYDIYSGFDPGHIELADVLSANQYKE